MTTAQQAADSAGQRDLSTAELQQRARQFVLDYIARYGTEPTGEQVGNAHGMSERWGRNQISSVRGTRAGTAPARRHGTSGTARGTVGEAVAARTTESSGTAGPATAVIGAAGPAPAAARPPAPPARSGAPNGTGSGPGSDQADATSGTAAPRHSGTAARPSGTHAPAQPPAHAHGGGGQVVAWLGFGFGAFVSVAANVMAAWIPHPPEGLEGDAAAVWTPPEGWGPDSGAVVGAAVWPLMLLLAVEVMSRVRWAPGWQWTAARFGGVGVVGLGSAIISYGHIRDVLLEWHYGEFSAHIGPLVVDGLMVISGFALLSISQASRAGGRS